MIITHLKREAFKCNDKENCSTFMKLFLIYEKCIIISEEECMMSVELDATIKEKLSIELKY